MRTEPIVKPLWTLTLFCAMVVGVIDPGAAALQAGTGGENTVENRARPHLVLVSVDGCRWDFPTRYDLPALDRLAGQGAQAERLLPVWPTLTFPNHYSLVTGLLPARHGLVGNTFYRRDRQRWFRIKDREAVADGSYYGGEPLWVSAETQGMVAATYYWVGSEASIGGVRPTHWKSYDPAVPGEERVRQVLEWLSEPALTRPHVVTLYFEDIDSHAHRNGLDSPPFLAAVDRVNAYLGQLIDGIDRLPHASEVFLAIVSDHGQSTYADAPPFVLADHVALDDLKPVDGGAYVFAWQNRPDAQAARHLADAVNRVWSHGRALTREDVGVRWPPGGNENLPDLVFQADPGYAVLSTRNASGKINRGDHGWAPEMEQMHGIFLIRGPGIEAGSRIGPVRNIDLYPLFMTLLGLRLPDGLDGEAGELLRQLTGGTP